MTRDADPAPARKSRAPERPQAVRRWATRTPRRARILSGTARPGPVEKRRGRIDTRPIIEMLAGGAHADRTESMLRRAARDHARCRPAGFARRGGGRHNRRGPRAARILDGLHAPLSGRRVGPGRCMPPLDAAVPGAVRGPDRAAPDLDTADGAALARALADPRSTFFITRGKAILASPGIVLYEEEAGAAGRRKAGLVIIGPAGTCPASISPNASSTAPRLRHARSSALPLTRT